MKILLTGAAGQLAHDLLPALQSQGHSVTALDRTGCDITNPVSVQHAFQLASPEAVVNCAAYNQVDRAESDPAAAFAVNATGPLHLARACRAAGAMLLHISTNYVFGGDAVHPYLESDPPWPLGVYAASKLSGEFLALAELKRCYIVRTTGLYGLGGRHTRQGNFVETMLDLAARGGALRVVHDQLLTPTSTADLAPALARLLISQRFGLYHLTNSGAVTWFDFAQAIFTLAGLPVPLTAVSSLEFNAPARRPAYSVLANSAWASAGQASLPDWRDALARYMRSRAGV